MNKLTRMGPAIIDSLTFRFGHISSVKTTLHGGIDIGHFPTLVPSFTRRGIYLYRTINVVEDWRETDWGEDNANW